MVIDAEEIFGKYRPIISKLLTFGFTEADGEYRCDIPLLTGEVTLKARVSDQAFRDYTLWDNDFDDECIVTTGSTLLIEATVTALKNLRDSCFYQVVYPYEQANRMHEYMENKFGIKAEFPWEDENGVYRNTTSDKWFAIVMYVKNKSLGLPGDGHTNCMNVKSDRVAELIPVKGFRPAYHMNKKYWITILLNDALPDEAIQKEIDASYVLTTKIPKMK